ncbi:MAG: F0F1 ATP synthase subunit delta [Betaproteobacteria bacterium]|nr:F0F1 ATP synthase subunit delta [Betaproteobacteria bacterium]
MAEIATIARPYAEAVFSLAKETKSLPAWSSALALVQAVNVDPEMRRLATDPAFGKDKLIKLFLDVCGQQLGPDASRFLQVLIHANRLDALPEIIAQFEVLRACENGVKEASVVSAYPLDATQVAALTARLSSRFGGTIDVTQHVDPEIIGGLIITIGDEVYDASVRGKLQDMANTLNR